MGVDVDWSSAGSDGVNIKFQTAFKMKMNPFSQPRHPSRARELVFVGILLDTLLLLTCQPDLLQVRNNERSPCCAVSSVGPAYVFL